MHPREHLQAGYVSPKLPGWSHPLEPCLPKVASTEHQLRAGKGGRFTTCLQEQLHAFASITKDGHGAGVIAHQSQMSLCGSLTSLLCSLVKAQTPCG